MDFGVGAYLLQAALVFGAPESLGSYEKGLFCESVALVERVADLAERRADPRKIVADIGFGRDVNDFTAIATRANDDAISSAESVA